jgi:hypothetical protein
MYFNLKYYLNKHFTLSEYSPTPLLYTEGVKSVKDLPHYAGTAILADSDLLANLNQNVKTGELDEEGLIGDSFKVAIVDTDTDEIVHPELLY